MDLATLMENGMDTAQASGLLLNVMWTMVGAVLVYFMQAGFAMCEAGFTRAKNSGNILMKNMLDFVLGSLFFFIFGFAIMHGTDWNGIIGIKGFFNPASLADADGMINGLPVGVFMIFHTVFCATAATIVSGSMAERTKFAAYLAYSAAISIIIYPVSGHWIWGGGFLSQMGFHDFAGSTAVHMVGGLCALVGAKILGPRIGKYTKDGKARAIPGHNLPIAALGVFILWFCWFGFNCGSTTAASTSLGDIAMTTNLAAAAATLMAMCVTWLRYGKPDVSMTFNGALAGLVAITAGCDVVSSWEAIIIGLVAGLVVVFSIEIFDQKIKIDDPVGAVSVHGICGALGTILTGVFGEGCSLGTQITGVASVAAYVLVMAFVIFTIINKTIGLRVSREEETEGLDVHEHGSSAYADFNFRL
ncbi:ammonium transporter [[Clostridium] hylemonae]|uniref:Ammonium transporter n=1 Tax=[Clostridium] hylemonae DSM 15053 TaxID=553973 RepID=C0C2M5_9FIRM|nr:ammonium transporter [[Clostridium] hylemonae]EEG73649.1 ammonium transporter [[Clostridium] hylemonae DSM 15053]QEK17250.1 Ammonia channel [[Clostridium] hylemonae DSM 15053]